MTVALGEMAICSHCFRAQTGLFWGCRSEDDDRRQRAWPSVGRKEKMGEGRAEHVPELGSLRWLPLLYVLFTYSSSSPSSALLTGWPCGFQGVWPSVLLPHKASAVPWLLHSIARRLNPRSLPSSACFCPRVVIAAEAGGDLEQGAGGALRHHPRDGWSTWFATPLPASGVHLRCLAGALQWPATGRPCSRVDWVQRALVGAITAFGSVAIPLRHQKSPGLHSAAAPA